MALPKIETPTYNLILPSTGEKIKYRPFLVKEEKILLIATESEDAEAMQNAVKDIISNCTFGKIDPDDMAPFDVEWIFLQLRIKSKGENVDLTFRCNNEVDGEECGTVNNISIDLREINIDANDMKEKVIKITDSVGVEMTYPTFKSMENINEDASAAQQALDMILNNIVCVFDGDEVYNANEDFTKEEITEFIDSLTEDQFKNIRDFFEDMPKIVYDVDYKCKKCGYEETLHLEGLQSFLV